MILDVEKINAVSPYPVFLKEQEGLVEFTSDYGVQFIVGFMKGFLLDVEGSYEFIIANANNRKSPSDRKVKETITAIITNFFEQDTRVMLYLCETSDGKQAMRNRLFRDWFSHYEQRDSFVFLNTSYVDEDSVRNYISIISKSTNPNLPLIMEQFTEAVTQINQKPEV